MSSNELSLPSVFRPVLILPGVTPKVAALAELARAGTLDDGTLFWSDDEARLACGVILEPDDTITLPDLARACEIAIVDALGSLLPPQLPVQTIENAIAVDGTAIGSARIEPVETSPFHLLTVDLPIAPGQAGLLSLADCGAGNVGARDLLQTIARQLVHWIGELEDKGGEQIRKSWQERTVSRTI